MSGPVATRHHVAVSASGGTVVIEERDVPLPGPGRVLVEVSHCGICGWDLHMIVEGWGPPGVVHGHEYAGVVAALGEGVTGVSIGDRVVGGGAQGCGRCDRCLAGRPSQCAHRGELRGDGGAHDGAYARYVSVAATSLVPVPEGLSLRAAALAEPLAVALHGLSRSGATAGESAMVMGAGPIGALTVAVLADRGVGPLAAVEPSETRRQMAFGLGADTVLRPDELPTFGIHQPEEQSPLAVDVVYECSGRRSAMEAGLQQLRRGGRMVMLGAGIEPPSFDPNRILLNELTVTGSLNYDPSGFSDALALLASGRLRTDLLIDPDDVPLAELGAALERLTSGAVAGKVMVVPTLGAEHG